MTVTIGWWAVPIAITVVLWVWALFINKYDGGYYGFDIVGVIRLFGAVAGTLFVWMVYGLLT